MLRNYFLVSFRNIKKNKWFTLINVFGLAIGMAASLLVYIHIRHELSFDDFHHDLDRLYRVTQSRDMASGTDYTASVPYPFITVLDKEFTQFQSYTQLHRDYRPLAVVRGEKSILEGVIFADSNFFDVLNFKVVAGNPKKTLAAPGQAFLSQGMATRLFGEDSPVGEKINLRNQLDVEIAGIFEDVPTNSHLAFDMVVSYASFSSEYFLDLPLDSWTMAAEASAYVKLKPGLNPRDVDDSFEKLIDKYYSEEEAVGRKYHLQPVREIYFDDRWAYATVSPGALWTFGIIGSFILLVACVNFINLSTSIAIIKSKEIGVRKTLGAVRSQLVFQSLSDTFVVTLLSILLAFGLVERLLPVFNRFFDKQLTLHFMEILPFALSLLIIVTLLAGLYPAFVLSGYNPVKALKSNVHSQSGSSLLLRKGLIIGQFFISQVLIIATIVVARQVDYFTSKPLGFDKEALINVSISDNNEVTLQRFRDRLLAHPGIDNVSFCLGPPVSNNNMETEYYLTENGPDQKQHVEIKVVDYHYKDTYGITLKHGRWFNPGEEKGLRGLFNDEPGATASVSYIINEAAAKKIGFSDPADAVGVNITTGINDISAPVVGVIKDYHLTSFRDAIGPAIMMHLPMLYYNAGIKMSQGNGRETVAYVEKVFNDLFPGNLFEYRSVDEELIDFYAREKQMLILFQLLSGLSIFISCLGLFGMVSFIISQRMKEVGIRKVMGASVQSIVLLFSKDFMILVALAFVIAAPVAWYGTKVWLTNFAYKIDLQVWFFLMAVLLSMVIAFISVGYRSWRAAHTNPVMVLKNE